MSSRFKPWFIIVYKEQLMFSLDLVLSNTPALFASMKGLTTLYCFLFCTLCSCGETFKMMKAVI